MARFCDSVSSIGVREVGPLASVRCQKSGFRQPLARFVGRPSTAILPRPGRAVGADLNEAKLDQELAPAGHRALPSGRLGLRAYSPYRDTSWERTWREKAMRCTTSRHGGHPNSECGNENDEDASATRRTMLSGSPAGSPEFPPQKAFLTPSSYLVYFLLVVEPAVGIEPTTCCHENGVYAIASVILTS